MAPGTVLTLGVTRDLKGQTKVFSLPGGQRSLEAAVGRVAKQEHLENKETQNCLSGRPVHPQERPPVLRVPSVLRRSHSSSGGPSVLGRSGQASSGSGGGGRKPHISVCFAGPQGTMLQHITCEAQNGASVGLLIQT